MQVHRLHIRMLQIILKITNQGKQVLYYTLVNLKLAQPGPAFRTLLMTAYTAG